MSAEYIDLLDGALDRLRANDPIPEILENFGGQADYLAPLLRIADALISSAPVEMPSDEIAQTDRMEFLASLDSLGAPSWASRLMISIRERIDCMHLNLAVDKQRVLIMRFSQALLVLILFFGLTGGAYALTLNSLPDSPLYEAKLAVEQTQLKLKSKPVDIASYHFVIAQHRIQETRQLVITGKLPDESAINGLEDRLDSAFQLSAQLSDHDMQAVLTQATTMLEEQSWLLAQGQIANASQAGLLQMMLQVLTQAQNQAKNGLQDPDAFRGQYQPEPQSQLPESILPLPTEAFNEPCADCAPTREENQYGNQTEKLTPNHQVDNFECPDCPCDGCAPVDDQTEDGVYTEQPEPGPQGENPACGYCLPVDCVVLAVENPPKPQIGLSNRIADCPPCDECMPPGNQYGSRGKFR